ncbi:hypothetical protein CHUAL_007680 [Chamberlinius hualienensis]
MKSSDSYTDSDIFVFRFKLPQLPFPASIFLAVSANNSNPKFQVTVTRGRRPSLADFGTEKNHLFFGLAWSIDNKPLFSDDSKLENKMTSLISKTDQGDGSIYFGLLIEADNGSVQGQTVSFEADILALTCLRWSDKSEDWFTTSCQPVVSAGNNNPQLVHCRCSQLSMITAYTSRIPYNYDKYKPYKFRLIVPFNPTIIYLLLALLLLLVLLILFGYFINRYHHYRRGVTLVKDNVPTQRYAYLLTVHTSNRLMSFTSSTMAVKLLGTLLDTPFHHLSDRSRTQFQTGSQDMFLIFTETSLGSIQGLSVLITATGSSPSWYLNQIRVYNLQTEHSWKFEANKWIKLKSDQQIMFKLPGKVYTSKSMDKQYSYKERLLQRFNEYYIFFNCLYNSTITHFTYAKRIVCIVIIVLLALFINLLLRGLPANSPVEHIGPAYFQVMKWDIIWGFVTAPILLLFNLIIVFSATQTITQYKHWQIFIDHDEHWKELNYEAEMDTYTIPLGNHTIIITLSSHKSNHIHDYEQAKVFKPVICDVCRQNAWCFFTVAVVAIVVLVILNVIYGLRYSVVKSLQWIFSSMIGFLVCALILFPIALIILTAFLKMMTSDKYENRRSLVGRLVEAFNARTQTIEKKVVSGSLLGAGDCFQQMMERSGGVSKRKHDWRRTGRMVAVGFMLGPLCHTWYRFLDRRLPAKTLKTVVKKVAADQMVAAPVLNLVFFVGMGVMEQKSWTECKHELKEKFLFVYLMDWLFWPPVQALNFYMVPPAFRVLYVNVALLLWDIFLSRVKHQEQ